MVNDYRGGSMTDKYSCIAKKAYLAITRSGDFGGDNPNNRYFQQAKIDTIPGIYNLDDIDCCGYHDGVQQFEIVSVCQNEVILKVCDKSYKLAANNSIEITYTQRQTSYDGPSWTGEDTIEFVLVFE